MAEHIYLKLDGIDGSSQRKGHEKWIELLSYSHSLSYSVGSGKDFAGAVEHAPLSIMKMVDASSYALIEKLNRRAQIKTILLEIWRDKGEGEGKVDAAAVKIKLGNCRVSSYSMSGSDDGQLPVEAVTFAYQTIEWTFPGNKTTDHDFSKPFGA
jgi:type VI secretion system secreted protein Hcp